jgi:UDP-N-acetylglucosamine 2-epimerase (non-hydrolysing)
LIRHRVLTVLGTRPEAIKLAPVIKELESRSSTFESLVCSTGQHQELLAHALEPFDITADFELRTMTQRQTLAGLTASVLTALDDVLCKADPSIVLVQGDTTTALCGALGAFYRGIRVGHVEAGLRTGDKRAPFPEEANRCLIARVADYHFAPTSQAEQALMDEGVDKERVFLTGNTSVDAVLWIKGRLPPRPPKVPDRVIKAIESKALVLVTGHRRESFGPGFESICRAIRRLADIHQDAVFVYPVHLNPNVQRPVQAMLSNHERIHLLSPLPYADFIWLLSRSELVLTDSGGVQEEGPVLGRPVIVMRSKTERVEGLAAGSAVLVGVSEDDIVQGVSALLADPNKTAAKAVRRDLYGDGNAARRIVDVLEGLSEPKSYA